MVKFPTWDNNNVELVSVTQSPDMQLALKNSTLFRGNIQTLTQLLLLVELQGVRMHVN